MIQLYYGDGKGKTTAAVGAAIRAAGRERRILFARFMKSGDSGELHILSALPGCRVLGSDSAFPFFAQMTSGQKQELAQIHAQMLKEIAEALQKRETDFVVLDEITHACRLQLVDEAQLRQVLAYGKSQETELILTGRSPSAALLEISDYSSEIKCIRHPYQSGVTARCGIEF